MKTDIEQEPVKTQGIRNRLAMMTENELTKQEEQFRLPMDMQEWFSSCTLMEWIEEEVDKLDWNNPEVVGYLNQHPEYHPKAMLCVLSYAYATQVFGSEEIVRKCYADTVLRLLCEGQAPEAEQLMRFRRENRGLLKGILAYVFLRAVREKFNLGARLLPPGLKRYLVNDALERLDVARHMDILNE